MRMAFPHCGQSRRLVLVSAASKSRQLAGWGSSRELAVASSWRQRASLAARFRVERVLAGAAHSSPEGRDRMIGELRPVFATLPPSAMRMELTRMVSGRLALPESLAATLLEPDGGRRGRARDD